MVIILLSMNSQKILLKEKFLIRCKISHISIVDCINILFAITALDCLGKSSFQVGYCSATVRDFNVSFRNTPSFTNNHDHSC